MTLTQKTDHVDEAKALLVQQFKGKTNLEALLTAFVNQIQELEDVFFELLENRWLTTATGTQLDGIGKIVGLDRLWLDDDDYRAALRAQIRLNRSSGTIPDNITILELLITNSFRISEWYPAAFNVIVSDEFTEDPENIARRLSRGAAIKAYLEYTEVDDDYTFTFADEDTIQTDGARGFAGDQDADEMLNNWDFDAWTGDDPDNWTVTGETGATKEVSEVASGNGHGGGGVDACNFFSSIGGDLSIKQTIVTTAGYRYQLRLNISLVNSGQLNVKSTAGDISETGYTTTGEKIIDFTAVGTSVEVVLNNNSANIDLTVDDVSVIPLGGVFAGIEEIA